MCAILCTLKEPRPNQWYRASVYSRGKGPTISISSPGQPGPQGVGTGTCLRKGELHLSILLISWHLSTPTFSVNITAQRTRWGEAKQQVMAQPLSRLLISVFPSFPAGSCLTHRREFPAALPMPATEVLWGIHEGKNSTPWKTGAESQEVNGLHRLMYLNLIFCLHFSADLEKVWHWPQWLHRNWGTQGEWLNAEAKHAPSRCSHELLRDL